METCHILSEQGKARGGTGKHHKDNYRVIQDRSNPRVVKLQGTKVPYSGEPYLPGVASALNSFYRGNANVATGTGKR